LFFQDKKHEDLGADMQAHKAQRKTHKSTPTLFCQDQTLGSLPSAASDPKAEAALGGVVHKFCPMNSSQSPLQVSNTSLRNVKIGSGYFASCKFLTIPILLASFKYFFSKFQNWGILLLARLGPLPESALQHQCGTPVRGRKSIVSGTLDESI